MFFKKIIKILLSIIIYYLIISAVLIFYIPRKKLTSVEPKSFYSHSNGVDRVILLEDGFESFIMRLDMIKKAQKNIDVCYYQIGSGDFSDAFIGALIEKAKEGVKIRILTNGMFKHVDRINSIFYGIDNIEVKHFNKPNILKPWTFQNLCHDKILIIDDYAYMTGGRNIDDRFFRKDMNERKTVKDRDVLIYSTSKNTVDDLANKDLNIEENRKVNYYIPDSNSSIFGMKKYYDRIFNSNSSNFYKIKANSKGKIRREDMIFKYKEFEKHYPEIGHLDYSLKSHPTNKVSIVHNELKNFNKYPEILQSLYALAETSEAITIQSPYIIPTNYMLKFRKPVQQTAQIKILTNSVYSSPNIMGMAGYLGLGKKKLLNLTKELYEYKGEDSIHAKSIVFDKRLSMIGSLNLDNRSSFINTETIVLIDSEPLAQELKMNIDKICEQSKLASDKDSSTFKNFSHEQESSFLNKLLVYVLAFLSHIVCVFI